MIYGDAITVPDVYVTRENIAPMVQKTSLISSVLLKEYVVVRVDVRLENLHETGILKIRGGH